MSNKIAFNMALSRATKLEATRKSFNEDLTIDVPTQTILWANARIAELEEKLAKQTKQSATLRKTTAILRQQQDPIYR